MGIVFSIIVIVPLTLFLLKDILYKDERIWAFVIFFQHIPLIVFDQIGSELIGMGYFVVIVILYLIKSPKLILSKSRLSNPITLSLVLLFGSLLIHFFILDIDSGNSRGYETFYRVMLFNLPIIMLCLFSISGDEEFLTKLMDGLIFYGFFFLITVIFVSGLAEVGVGERGGFRDDFRISPLAAAKTAGVISIAAFIKLLNVDHHKEKLFTLGILTISVLLIFVTASRAALLFLLIVIVIYLAFANYSIGKKLLITISFITISAFLILIIVQINLPVVQRLQALQNYEQMLRFTRLEIVINIVKDFEMGIIGLGPFGFGHLTGLNYPHNHIAELMVDYGLFGITSLILLIIPAFYYSYWLITSKNQNFSYIALLFIYLFLTSLTSGDIVSARHLQFTAIIMMNYVIISRKNN